MIQDICITGLTFAHFAVFIVYVAFAVLIMGSRTRSPQRVRLALFLILLIAGTLQKITEHNPCTSYEYALSVYRWLGFSWIGLSPAAFLLALGMSRFEKAADSKALNLLLAAFTVVFYLIELSGGLHGLKQAPAGWTATGAGPVYPVYNLIDNAFVAATVLLLVYTALWEKNPLKKSQAMIVTAFSLTGTAIMYVTRLLSGFESVDFVMLFPITGVIVAMVLYGFMQLTPSYAANAIFRTSSEMMVLLTPEGHIAEANNAFLDWCGLTVRELGGRRIYDFISSPSEFSEKDRTLLHKDGVLRGREARLTLPGVNGIDVLITASELKMSGFVTGYACVISDVTRLKRIESELRQYKEGLEALIQERTEKLNTANAALQMRIRTAEEVVNATFHDLREPVISASKLLQLAQRDENMNGTTRTYIEETREMVLRMDTMLTQLRSYISAENEFRESASVNLFVPLSEALNKLKDEIAASGAVIESPRLNSAMADIRLISDLFYNILSNAIKFRSGTPPRITVTSEEDDDHVTVSISDNGIGVAPEYSQKIFSVFERLNPRSLYRGSGMGLAICKKIIDLHGGRIWVEERAGGGSVFKFTLKKAQG